ncbi:MAG: alcohol dehydrogenase catalytic domain-containing protein, partial [Hyphomicrobiaceae bacterium]|nr:alcohol dehydrogenase catalytic domain-containing protein [Hyphomicrobiaceae bacterium]
MKAALCTSLTGISAVAVSDIDEPDWPNGEAVIAVRRTALNHSDVLRTLGTYQEKAALPFSPGGEIAGVVERAPAHCEFRPGQRVMAYIGHGGARERISADPSRLIAIPNAV